ncbi:MAG: GWxTD domain-containing protein [Bacteroidota bacterium]
MQKNVVFLLLFIGFPLLLCGQERPDPRLRYGDLIYAEAAAMPSDSAGAARIDVFVRVSYDFMIFSRTNSLHPDSLFSAGVELTYSLRSGGITVRSQNQFARVCAGDYDSTNSRDRFVLLRQSFYVEPGIFEVTVFVADRGSTRENSLTQVVKALKLTETEMQIGQPVPLKKEEERGDYSYSVLAFGRTLPFAEDAVIGVPVTHGLDATWQVQLLRDDDESGAPVFSETVQPEAQLVGVVPAGESGVVEDFHIHTLEGATGDLVVLSLPFSGMDVGSYRLLVTATWDGGGDSISLPTEIFWRDMPFSMRDLEFAIDAMRFILTAEEYRQMKNGDTRSMQKAFRRFWKNRDATPDTEFNEMMAEYFRRVDQAYYKFQTIYDHNGVQTDRGKVYVLFGPPDDTKRIMNREEPINEIWEYQSLGKSFRFVDTARDGNLRLVEE